MSTTKRGGNFVFSKKINQKRCNLCYGVSGWKFPKDIVGLHNVKMCDTCGLIRTESGLSRIEIDEFYKITFKNDPGAINAQSQLDELEQVNFLQSKEVLNGIALPLLSTYMDLKGKKCLEIRFRTGAWLEILLEMGASEVTGVDLFKANVDTVNSKNSTATVSQCSVFDLPGQAQGQFDLISGASIHVLSHVPDLRIFLARVYDLLATNGIIFFDEKDISMITEEAKTLPLCDPNPMAHYFHFTLDTVRNVVENCGFEIMFCEIYKRKSDLAHIAVVAQKSSSQRVADLSKVGSFMKREELKTRFEMIVSDHREKIVLMDRGQ